MTEFGLQLARRDGASMPLSPSLLLGVPASYRLHRLRRAERLAGLSKLERFP